MWRQFWKKTEKIPGLSNMEEGERVVQMESKMKTDAGFENINSSYVKFIAGSEKNYEKILGVTKDEGCASEYESKIC